MVQKSNEDNSSMENDFQEGFENEEGIFHSMIQTAYKGKELPRSLCTTQNTHL